MSTIGADYEKRLEDIAKRDQEARKPWDAELARAVEIEGTELAQEIIEHLKSWPKISEVGEAFSLNLWLLVQHTSNKEFREHCLELIEKLPEGEIKPSYYALLKDRVLVNQGKPQLYGSQVLEVDDQSGTVYFAAIEDIEHIDERRASLGMQPLHEYAKHFTPEFNNYVALPATRLRITTEELTHLNERAERFDISEQETIFAEHNGALIQLQFQRKIGKHYYKVAECQLHLQAVEKFTDWAGNQAEALTALTGEKGISHLWGATFATYYEKGYSHQLWDVGDKLINQTQSPYRIVIDDSKNHWTSEQVKRRQTEGSITILWETSVDTEKGPLPVFIYKTKAL